MKKWFVLVVIFAALSLRGNAQTAIAMCTVNGTEGHAYYDEPQDDQSLAELRTYALKFCRDAGGVDCQIVYESDCTGCWAGFIRGTSGTDFNFLAGTSFSDEELVSQLKAEYLKNGGVGFLNAVVKTWYVPKF